MQNATERAENPVEFWEDHYRTKKTDYSGNPGEFLVRYVADLTPGMMRFGWPGGAGM